MYENEDGDEEIYAAYYNDIHNGEQVAGEVYDSDIDGDDVDRLYSQIYHEVCEESETFLSDPKHRLSTQHSCSLQNKNLGSKGCGNPSGKDNLTELKSCNINEVDKVRSTHNAHLSKSPIQRSVLTSKDVFCLDKCNKLKGDLKKKNSNKSQSWPDLKDMLINRSVDNPDSDGDHVEIIGIDRSRIKNHHKICNTTVNDSFLKLESVSSLSDHSRDKKNSSVVNTKVNDLDLFRKLERSGSVPELSRVKKYSKIHTCNTNIDEFYSFHKLENSVSPSKQADCVVISSDSQCSSSDKKKSLKARSAKKREVGKFVVVDGSSCSSSSDSDSDSSSEDECDTTPPCLIDSDSTSSTSWSSPELSDSTSGSSFNGDLEELKGNIRVNVNRSQQHFLDGIMDENKEPLLWNICDRDRFGGKILNGRYYQTSTVRCRNCNEIGHLSKHCCSPKKLVSCILCGLGHFYRKCPNTLCFNCDAPGHETRNCTERRRHWYDLCNRCGMQGHFSANCPDIWRQYHMTTTSDQSVPHKGGNPNPRVFCYNCAQPKHFGYECNSLRQNTNSLPSYPFVAYYGFFKSNHKKTEFRNKTYSADKKKEVIRQKSGDIDFPRSSAKPESPMKTFKKKRKLCVEGLENCIPRKKKCKKAHKQLPEANEKDVEVLKDGKKRKKKVKIGESSVEADHKETVLKKGRKKGKKKKGCETVEVDDDTKQEMRHQVNDNRWWTEDYKRRQEKKWKKKEKKRLKNIERKNAGTPVPKKRKKKKKVNGNVAPPIKTNVKRCSKFHVNLQFKNNFVKQRSTERGFSISKMALNTVDR